MRFWIAILLVVIGFNTHVIWGKESDKIFKAHVEASIISASDFNDDVDRSLLALKIKLEQGWHTYWLNPGDAGEPASLQVSINHDRKIIFPKIEWPVPKRLFEKGLLSYIYDGEVILPFYLHIPESYRAKDLHLHIKATWLICANICVPVQAEFTIDLPKGKINQANEAILIQKSLNNKPRPLQYNLFITPNGKLWGNKTAPLFDQVQDAWFMPERLGLIDQDQKQHFKINPEYFELKLPLLSKKPLDQSLAGILALKDYNGKLHYWSIHPIIKKKPVSHILNLFLLISSAFLGGCLLNFMPCVFPVIAMKLLSLSRLGNKNRAYQYRSCLSYTAGILSSFTGISLTFISLRWTGKQITWGFQFQSVSFLIILCWLLFIIALNLLDVFTINFSFYSRTNSSSYLSDFLTGILAVLVATPCTAPFMGIAVAAALNSSAEKTFFIFIGMGLGLSFPYLLLVFIPKLTRFLPRPGIWMEILKQFLAFPLLLSCVWLIWVIYQHDQSISLLTVLLGCVLIGFGAWLLGKNQLLRYKTATRVFQRVSSIMLILIFILLGGMITEMNLVQSSNETVENREYMVFSLKNVQQLQIDHKAVFVNMTASWCLTCLVNDKVALSNRKIRDYFHRHHIQYVIGDWTHHNNEISRFLKQFGREGVPLYIYYPAYGNPRVLPQILTPDLVIKNIENVKN